MVSSDFQTDNLFHFVVNHCLNYNTIYRYLRLNYSRRSFDVLNILPSAHDPLAPGSHNKPIRTDLSSTTDRHHRVVFRSVYRVRRRLRGFSTRVHLRILYGGNKKAVGDAKRLSCKTAFSFRSNVVAKCFSITLRPRMLSRRGRKRCSHFARISRPLLLLLLLLPFIIVVKSNGTRSNEQVTKALRRTDTARRIVSNNGHAVPPPVIA